MGVDSSTRTENRAVGVGGEENEMAQDQEEDVRLALEADADGLPPRKKSRAEREEALVELSRREDIYDLLSRSLAPSIWEMEDVKKGILLQMFGGTNKTIGTGGGGGGPRYRGDINVLLVGDPGTSKSQILQVSRFFPFKNSGADRCFSMYTRLLLEVYTLPARDRLLSV